VVVVQADPLDTGDIQLFNVGVPGLDIPGFVSLYL
jgi:hypothetical protein